MRQSDEPHLPGNGAKTRRPASPPKTAHSAAPAAAACSKAKQRMHTTSSGTCSAWACQGLGAQPCCTCAGQASCAGASSHAKTHAWMNLHCSKEACQLSPGAGSLPEAAAAYTAHRCFVGNCRDSLASKGPRQIARVSAQQQLQALSCPLPGCTAPNTSSQIPAMQHASWDCRGQKLLPSTSCMLHS